jgi:hypothetical protein
VKLKHSCWSKQTVYYTSPLALICDIWAHSLTGCMLPTNAVIWHENIWKHYKVDSGDHHGARFSGCSGDPVTAAVLNVFRSTSLNLCASVPTLILLLSPFQKKTLPQKLVIMFVFSVSYLWNQDSQYSDCLMGWMVAGLNPSRDNRFFSFSRCLDQLWGPLCQLCNGYHGSFQWVK